MNKVIILQGIPASGKSTWAKEFIKEKKDWVIVSRDAIREARGKYWIPSQEKYISDIEIASINSAIAHDLNIIIDATNLNRDTLDKFNVLFKDTKYDIEIKRFDISYEEAVERDSRRDRKVGAYTIATFYNKYIREVSQDLIEQAYLRTQANNKENTRFILQQDQTLEQCIVVDIDGTLAIANGRNIFDYSKVETDLPNNPVVDLINTLSDKYKIIIMSGREDKGNCRQLTTNWLNRYLFRFDELHMRPNNDYRKDNIVKQELYENNIKDKYCIAAVFDDRDQVVKMWRDLGILCNQVYYGSF